MCDFPSNSPGRAAFHCGAVKGWIRTMKGTSGIAVGIVMNSLSMSIFSKRHSLKPS